MACYGVASREGFTVSPALTMAKLLTHHRILVHRESIGIQGDHVTIFVRTKKNVLGVQHVKMVGRSSRSRQPRSTCPEHRYVTRRRALETAVIHDIGIHELERGESRHATAIVGDALDGLQGFPVVPEVGVVRQDQVRTIRLPGLSEPRSVHHGLDRCGTRRKAGRREALDVVLPEPPDGSIDSTNNTRVVGVGDEQLNAADLFSAICCLAVTTHLSMSGQIISAASPPSGIRGARTIASPLRAPTRLVSHTARLAPACALLPNDGFPSRLERVLERHSHAASAKVGLPFE
jgi:hypothetical protein